MNAERPTRKSCRLRDFDYNSCGAYFITICTHNRLPCLSRIVGGDVLDAPASTELLPYGTVVDKYINQLHAFYDDIEVNRYVIMPNHIHIILFVVDCGASRTSPPTKQHSKVSKFVSTLKRFCNKEYGKNIWQRSYHDHIIRDTHDLKKYWDYIENNPYNWKSDDLYEKV